MIYYKTVIKRSNLNFVKTISRGKGGVWESPEFQISPLWGFNRPDRPTSCGQGIKSETRHEILELSKGSAAKELYVKKIRNGSVIDHISAGHALDVLKILGIGGGEGHIVSVAMNVSSKTDSKKDIVKVENRELKPGEVDKIALIAPSATINIIRDYEVVEKTRVKLPASIRGIVRCANPACVSNAGEPVEPKFLVERQDPLRLRCFYCVRIMDKQDVLKQF
jgi:aspartate carbamoyltransferase regulatory subunit